MFDSFISYGRADSKAFATKLHVRLLEQGLKVWFDQNDIPLGVDYQNQIDDGIEKAHNFLFIIARHSVNSPYCRKEIELAIKRNKRIIPLLHVERISALVSLWAIANAETLIGQEFSQLVYVFEFLFSYSPLKPLIRRDFRVCL